MIGMKPPHKKDEDKDESSYEEATEPKESKEPPKEEEKEESDVPSDESKLSSASDVLDAVKSGDVKEFSSALERFIQSCSY